ncbi:serine/threonine-protein kinase [Streptomyces sp. NPDC001941]|uniref:serine/threonine-protein kinase n=1 Tax=Streptomyces sp. NPDC001941 TaxID=3154659 RepID=UPI003325C478
MAGRYRVVRQLGKGGMGVVHRAVDEVLGREVAVKELRTYTDSSGPELADLRLRMRREARAAARVRHPGVIAVHDVADHHGRPVIVMELVDGPSLDDVLHERGVLEPLEAARIGAGVLDALAAAHAAGVLHRDVKPGNVLLDRGGRVVLTDFGIAAMEDPGDGSATRLTRSGELVGSLDYLAPERAQGHQPGPASDVWALGATLYAAVEGASPFRRTSTWSTLNAIVVEPLPEPRRAGPLAPVLRLLMHKDPALRPDAATAARLLADVAEGRADTSTAPLGPPAHTRVPTVRNAVPHRPVGFGPASAPAPGAFGPAVPEPAPVPAVPTSAVPLPGGGGPSGEGGRGRRSRTRVVVAAAAAAVVLAGGGVTYALMGGGETATGRSAAGGGAASPEQRGEDGRVLEPGASAPGPSAPASASTAGEPGADDPSPRTGDRATAGPSPRPSASRAPRPGTKPTPRPTGGAGSGTGGGGGQDPAPAPACHAAGGGKYDCTVYRSAKTYRHDGGEMGVLGAGTNYFYCQVDLGRRETYGKWTNHWWARTDDDSGNTNVYFSVVYIKGGDNDAPLPGLPVC